MAARIGPRFGAESAFIIAVAVVAALLELSWPAVAAAVFTAWVVVAAVEIVASGRRRPAEAVTEPVEVPAPPLEPPLLPPPFETRPTAFPEPSVDEEPEPAAPGAPPKEPEPMAVGEAPNEPEPAAAAPRPSPPPPSPRVSRPEPARAPAPQPSAAPELEPTASGQWNLWELEGRAREWAGRDPLRDEEWSFLLMYLREFADADGMLPTDFDALVRESFAELIRGA